MRTLVVDIGQDLVGLFFVEEGRYVPYRGDAIPSAIQLIQDADEVVTYNGNNYDLLELGRLAGLDEKLPLKGIHTDMRSIYWSDRIWGSNLQGTYARHFTECPKFPDTHEGSNECDTYKTFKLWRLWKTEKVKVIDGHTVPGVDGGT
jgi:hypothetical protein